MSLGYHDFIIGSDILLIKATFMGRKFVNHTQICGVDLRIKKKKVGLANLSPSLYRVGPPTLAS